MDKLQQKWGAQLLKFALELPKGHARFPRHLLRLLSEYFHFDRLLFFPYIAADGISRFPSKQEALNNFCALNIDAKGLREYARGFYRIDPFAPRNLPDSLKRRKVVFIEDIMSLEHYEKTEYYRDCYAPRDLYYQACIFLKINNENAATVNIYRPRRGPAFGEEDKILFEHLSDLISVHYAEAFKFSATHMALRVFDLSFKNLPMGVVMLDRQLIVLKANSVSNEYCRLLMEGAGRDDEPFQRSIYSQEDENHYVQQVINGIGLELTGESGALFQTRLFDDFVFYYNPFLFTNIYGQVETRYLVFITRVQRAARFEANAGHERLSPRESSILNCVASGHSNKDICDELHVSIFTVRTHLSNIYKKFGVKNKVELMHRLGKSGEELVFKPDTL